VHRPRVSRSNPQKHLRVALLFQTPVTLKASKRAEIPLKLIHIGNHIRYARYLRRLTIEVSAGQIGTVSRNVILWELGGEPHIHSLPGVLRFLGYDPYPPPRTTLRERLYSTRRALGLDCKMMGKLYGVDQKTWWWWETGKHSPLSHRIEYLERFLELSYTKAVKGWSGNPPEDSRAVPATFRFKDRRPVAVKITD
jgi:hypothetical protein